MQPTLPPSSRGVGARVFVVLVAWFSVLLGLGVSGRLEDLPRIIVPVTLAGSTVTMMVLTRRDALSAWMRAIDIRALVGLHIVRLPIGMWFLAQYRSGELPGEIALLAGWGDIATGILAIATVPFDERTRWGRRAVGLFNVLGFIDILAVVVTAQKVLLLGGADVRVGHPFLLLPMFVVPMVIVAHVWTFVRLVTVTRVANLPAAVAAPVT